MKTIETRVSFGEYDPVMEGVSMRLWKTDIRTTIEHLPKRFTLNNKEPMNLKLTVDDMIPKPLSNKGLSKVLPKSHWNKICAPIYIEHKDTCAICGAVPESPNLHCHEIWSYDDKSQIQKLEGFTVLCRPCHDVKHGVWLKHLWNGMRAERPNVSKDLRSYARTRKFAAICRRSPDKLKNILDLSDDQKRQKLIIDLGKQSKAIMPCEHFLRINKCSFKTAENHFIEAVEIWGERSRYEWHIDYGEYSRYIREPN